MLAADQVSTFREEGVVCLRGALSAGLQIIRDAFDYRLANARRSVRSSVGEDGSSNYSDLFRISSWQHPTFQRVFHETPLADYASALTGSDAIWFFYEQVFVKEGGAVRRTPWHQDTPYLNAEGEHIVRFWIPLDPVVREVSLEFVRGSHRGTLYNGSAFDPADDTRPLYPGADLPRLPAIEDDRGAWDIVSFGVEPGDVIAFHPRILHGGAPTVSGRPRRTLSLMYFGEDATYVERPSNPMFAQAPGARENESRSDGERASESSVARSEGFSPKRLYAGLCSGDPFRDPAFPKLLPRTAASGSVTPPRT